MAFMEPEYVSGWWYEIDGKNGTDFLPAEMVASLPGLSDEGDEIQEPDDPECSDDVRQAWHDAVESLYQYTQNRRDIYSVTLRKGVGARLSAPGYMGCTDWALFDTEQEARDYIRDQYDVDPDTGDELTDE